MQLEILRKRLQELAESHKTLKANIEQSEANVSVMKIELARVEGRFFEMEKLIGDIDSEPEMTGADVATEEAIDATAELVREEAM